MAKGQMRPTKEKRKPKKEKDKAKPTSVQSRFSPTPVHIGGQSNPGGGKK
jgi:hypothetical protein